MSSSQVKFMNNSLKILTNEQRSNHKGQKISKVKRLFRLLYSLTSVVQRLEISRIQSLEISRRCTLELDETS